MKKLIKGCLIAGGILVILGIGICAGAGAQEWRWLRSEFDENYYGSLSGRIVAEILDLDDIYEMARAKEYMAQNEIQETIKADEPVSLAEIPAAGQIPEENQDMTQGNAGELLDEDEEKYLTESIVPESEYSFSGIRKLDLEISGGAVRVVPVEEGEEIRVIIGEGTSEYQCYQEEGALKIKHWTRRQKESHRTIEVQVPQNVSFDEADIEINGGILIAQEMDAWQTDIEVNGGIGKILQGAIETIDVEMNAGFFFMNGDVTRKADVSCNAGKAKLILAGTREDYGVSCEVFAGTVKVGEDSYTGRQEMGRNRTKQLELDCAAGTIEVNFNGQ